MLDWRSMCLSWVAGSEFLHILGGAIIVRVLPLLSGYHKMLLSSNPHV